LSTRDVDPDAEQEVDLGRYWSAIVARWWLPLLGLIVGVIVGYLISLGGKQVWNASSTVYLGASYSIIGGNLLQGPQANPATVGTIARAQDSIAQAAAKAGMRAGDLQGHVSTKSISTGAGASTLRVTANPLVRLIVQAPTRRKAQVAANTLAQIVVLRLSPFADKKIAGLQERIDADQQQMLGLQRLFVDFEIASLWNRAYTFAQVNRDSGAFIFYRHTDDAFRATRGNDANGGSCW